MGAEDGNILDATDPNLMVQLPGWKEPVPVRNIVPKAQYDALAQKAQNRERELEGAVALQEMLNDNPQALYEALGAKLGIEPLGEEEEKPKGDQTPPPQRDPEVARQFAELQAMQQAMLASFQDFQSRFHVDAETKEILKKDPEADINELMALAVEKKVPLRDAHRFKQADRFEARMKELEEQLAEARQEKAIPNLGLSDTRGIVEPRKRVTNVRESNDILKDLLARNAQKIASEDN